MLMVGWLVGKKTIKSFICCLNDIIQIRKIISNNQLGIGSELDQKFCCCHSVNIEKVKNKNQSISYTLLVPLHHKTLISRHKIMILLLTAAIMDWGKYAKTCVINIKTQSNSYRNKSLTLNFVVFSCYNYMCHIKLDGRIIN